MLETMIAHAQFCRSGDNTLMGTQAAIQVTGRVHHCPCVRTRIFYRV